MGAHTTRVVYRSLSFFFQEIRRQRSKSAQGSSDDSTIARQQSQQQPRQQQQQQQLQALQQLRTGVEERYADVVSNTHLTQPENMKKTHGSI